MPNDGGNLILTREDYQRFILDYPDAERFVRRFIGSNELINGDYRYCIWIETSEASDAMKYPLIKDRVANVRESRQNSKRLSTKKLAETPYSFGEIRHQNMTAIIIPRVSSENRYYIPMGLVDENIVISDSAMMIYNADIYLLGVLMSRTHMTWVKAVGGRLETRYRYSAGLCYNTFPLPKLSTRRKNEITDATLSVLDIREELGGTLAELYNPGTMPIELKNAHEKLDGIIDRAYRPRPFESDEERLALLLKMYQEMTEK